MKLENSSFYDNLVRNIKKQKSFTLTGLTTFSRLLLVKYIKDLSDWLRFFNKEIVKTIGKPNNYGYDVEIEYIIPHYIH